MTTTDEAAAARDVAAPLSTRLPRTLQRFLATETSGAVVLFAATVVALVWANSPWHASYESLWHTATAVTVGSWSLGMDLHQVVNDGLMALFFFVVGLEIKRELVEGELHNPRTAALPALAAAGGMIVPALLFVVVNAGSGDVGGWGIPMATDIAFALGVIALFGSRLPSGLRLFLLTLAIVDDIGAIIVIAFFYSGTIDVGALAGAGALLIAMGVIRSRGVMQTGVYVVIGVGVWLCTYQSGIHATIAGVALGLLTPASPITPGHVAREWANDLDDEPTAADIEAMAALAKSSVSVAERLQHRLHPLTSFVIIPLFALANAGVRIDLGSLGRPEPRAVAAGVVVGLVVGKAVGIALFSWIAVRLRLGRLPDDVTWAHVAGVAMVAGIGFTVSLFISGLAFAGSPPLESAAKTGVLGGSLLAAVLGSALLHRAGRTATRRQGADNL